MESKQPTDFKWRHFQGEIAYNLYVGSAEIGSVIVIRKQGEWAWIV